MEKRDERFSEIPGLVAVGIGVDDRRRIFDPDGFGRHDDFIAVSYTHLDVYKRQPVYSKLEKIQRKKVICYMISLKNKKIYLFL